jgi:hypothetical protein
MADQSNEQAIKHQYYGQEPMTAEERARFLSQARQDEAEYSKQDYVREDDPQHRFKNPEHPINLRSSIAYDEFRLNVLERSMQESGLLKNQLAQLEAERDAIKAEMVAKQETLLAKGGTRDTANQVDIVGKVMNETSANVNASVKGVSVDGVPWHKTADTWNYPANLTAGFGRTVESGLGALRSGQTTSSEMRAKPSFTSSDAKALFTNDKEGPTHTSWHKQVGVNPYTNVIPPEQLKRTIASDTASKGQGAANDQAARQVGGTSGNALQQAAETRTAVQAGDISIGSGAAITKNMSTILPVLGKAFTAHTLAPLGSEALFQADAAREAMDKSEKDYAKGLLTKAQLDIVNHNTKVTAAEASAAAIVPEPGLGIDKIVQAGDRKLVAELVQAGLPKERAEQYEMGSMIESGHRLAALASDSQANRNDVKQAVDANGAVPLSMALNINQSQLRQFGAMSATLGGEALKNEVARNPAFERLAHLSPQKIEGLSRMAAAGADPLVMDHGYITTVSNRPAKLSADSKAAFIESANYIMQSGDVAFRVPGNRPVELKATVENFAMTYERLAQDGGLSVYDKAALAKSINMMSEEIGTGRLQGVVARYEAAHPAPVAANDAEHAMSIQR